MVIKDGGPIDRADKAQQRIKFSNISKEREELQIMVHWNLLFIQSNPEN